MQRLEVSGAVRPIYGSLGVKRLNKKHIHSYLKCIVYDKLLKPRQNMLTSGEASDMAGTSLHQVHVDVPHSRLICPSTI